MIFTILLVVYVVVIGCFGFVLLFGAPYLPTLSPQIKEALDLLNLKKGQTMLELGCGDGRVLIAGAERGWKVVGYELNPIMVLVAKVRTRRYRSQVTVVWGNFFTKEWPQADGIFSFNLGRSMSKIDQKITTSTKTPLKLVSFAARIPNKKLFREHNGIVMYEYNA